MARRLSAVVLFALLFACGGGRSFAAPQAPVSSARAVAVQVLVPGQEGATGGAVSAPPVGAVSAAGFAYPADGSAVSTGALTAKVSTSSMKLGSSSSATVEVSSVSIFGGEITTGTISAGASATATTAAGTGDFPAAGVSSLVALGQEVATSPGTHVTLGDWGYADVLAQSPTPGSISGAPSYQGSMTALAVSLTADHGGLPAGSRILVGYAQVAALGTDPVPPSPPVPTTTAPLRSRPEPKPKPELPAAKKAPRAPAGVGKAPATRKKMPLKPPEPLEAAPGGAGLPVIHTPPLSEKPKLTAGRYVFPVYGPSSYTNTFGAPRADVVWHHGDDIFAPLGAPVLAVADGTIFSVGWNHLGGYRVWLRDRQGNQFYYAHLSAYSPVAVNGQKVRAGTVLGFVGATGDAVGTPYHLHFEIHPVSLIQLGYDGAVDPTPYLDAWKHVQDVRFAPLGWAVSARRPRPGVKPAPPPGAILLQATDISTASGLDPDSFDRVLATDSVSR
jgi:murein DD-endopeptidase MepM/ murein hydrolase activator NlpD